MTPRRPFPSISLEAPEITQASFDAPPMAPMGQMAPPQGMAGQINQLGQAFQLGRYKPKGALGGAGGGIGSILSGGGIAGGKA